MKITYHCCECGKECSSKGFGGHLFSKHNMRVNEYYDLYLKTADEGVCKFCGKPTKFNSISTGYRPYCSAACVSRASVHKIEQTKIERYGDPHYINKAKAKSTCLSRYGVEFAAQADCVKDKIKSTNLARYGVECASQSEVAKQHYIDTCMSKYGVKSTNELTSVKKRKEATYYAHYGVANPNQCDEVITKRKQTRIRRYGEYLNDSILDRMKATCFEKYGVEYALQSPVFMQKSKETCLAKYGVECYLQHTHEMALYMYNDVLFDSSWELAYYIWLEDHSIDFVYHPAPLVYEIKQIRHYYFPDFIVDNEYVELKGPHLINQKNELINPSTKEVLTEKTKCLVDNHVRIITDCKEYINYVKMTYGRRFIKDHKIARHKFTT